VAREGAEAAAGAGEPAGVAPAVAAAAAAGPACSGARGAGAAQQGGAAEAPGIRGLHCFAGAQPRSASVSGWAHVMGGAVADIDSGQGGAAHNVRRPTVRQGLARRLRARQFDFAVFGGPCATFSPLHTPQLRDVWSPSGCGGLPESAAHVLAANECWEATAEMAQAIFDAGGEFVIEHPQRRYLRGRRAFWAANASVATPGDLPALLELERATRAVRIDFAQCACGGRFQKFSTLLCSPRIGAELAWLAQLRCGRCDAYEEHEEQARGAFPDGSSRAAAAAAYPSELARAMAAAGVACPIGPRRDGGSGAAGVRSDGGGASSDEEDGVPLLLDGSDSDGSDSEEEELARPAPKAAAAAAAAPPPQAAAPQAAGAVAVAPSPGAGRPAAASRVAADAGGAAAVAQQMAATGVGAAESGDGKVASGSRLSPTVLAAVLQARRQPAAFASLRNLAPASAAELRAAAMPVVPRKRSERRPAPRNGVAPPPGCGGRPQGPLHVSQLFLPGVYARVAEWRRLAGVALRDIEAGRAAKPPGTLTISQAEMQPWARRVVWDARDAHDVVPVVPSTRESAVGGTATVDRAALRAAAAELDWCDADLLGQIGEGGLESRSECSWDTVLSFHHPGLAEHYEEAAKIVAADIENENVIGGFSELCFVPCRSLPRDVIMQPRSRVLPNGEVEDFEKPRVTTNSSDGKGGVGSDGRPLSVNDGVPPEERYVQLPAVRQLGRGAAIVGEAGAADGLRAELYCFDLSRAYRYTPIQRLDWWHHVFTWVDPASGEARFYVDVSGAFGGAYMPARFEGVTDMGMALVRKRQDEFDALHPYPPGVQAWQRERRARQAAGELPEGPEQTRPAYGQVYLDDGGGAALNDSVPVPEELQHISLGEAATRALGGTPSAWDSRAAVHLRIAVAAFESLGFLVETTKTECGTAIVNLGFRVDAARGRIDCPLPKRRILLRDLAEMRAAAEAGEPLQQRAAERLTGRLANLSHVLPELAPHLAGGYAVASARVAPRGRRGGGGGGAGQRRRRPGVVRLREGSRCHRAVLQMCDVSSQLLDANEGIALAAAEAFAPQTAGGTLTTVTDASGEDGVGGYAFHADAPGTVWMLAEEWPADVRAALARAAAPRAERTAGAACSMPLAELFGPWALATAAAEQGAPPIEAVVAVGDCKPAAAVLTAATSAGAQLRALVAAARTRVQQWLGVAVQRELNVDADTLSHPARWREVQASAEAAGLRVVRAHVPAECWAALREAMQLPMGREAAAWREREELCASHR